MRGIDSLIEIDGTHGEGGGALLRTALQMSALTQQGFRIKGIRGNLKYAGLDVEDLVILRALAESTHAEVENAEPGAHQFAFRPRRRPRGLNSKVGSGRNEHGRGANALVVLNALLPVLVRTGMYSSVVAEGETYGHNSLGYDSFAHVTLTALRAMGVYAYPTLERAGFGRGSDGIVAMDLEPSPVMGREWGDRGKRTSLAGIVSTSGTGRSTGERAVAHLASLAKEAGVPLEIEHREVESSSPGCFVTLWSNFERGFGSGTAIGAKGMRVEAIAQAAFDELMEWLESDATVDPYVADQILVPAIFAETPTSFRVMRLTSRFLTSVWVAKQFAPVRITVRGSEGGPGIVKIEP